MDCTITEGRSGFSVFPVARTVSVTTVTNGQLTTQVQPFESIFKGYRPSVFDASYEGDDSWAVDADCGAQRWYGRQTTAAVRKALRKCGFDTKTINALVKKYRV